MIHPALNSGDTWKAEAGKLTVPSVIGLGLREAVVTLEQAGLNVKFQGTGYVARQIPERGTPVKKGQTVTLALSN